MFWKLCKFEWKSSYRMYGMFYAILLICSVLIGMSSLPDVNLPGLVEFLINLTIIIYTAGIFAVNIITIVFIFRNYIKTMYRRQSYLTHTLPVTTWQIQTVKVLFAMLWIFLTFAVTIATVWIMMIVSGVNVLSDVVDAMVYAWQHIPNHTELILGLVWTLLEMIESISIVYFVINFVHTTYIQRYRAAIGIGAALIIFIVESICNNYVSKILSLMNVSYSLMVPIFILIGIILIGFWNYASVYLIEHKMEVE